MKNDRFRSVGSSVDDIRSWLALGGISLVREHLNNQMEICGFSPDKKAAVNDFLEQLVRDNRRQLLELMAEGILPPIKQDWLSACGLSGMQFEDLLRRILAGERPFEDWMHANGHSDEEIAEVYRKIDQWLMQKGIIPQPPPDPGSN
ncbi:MAG: hypothetical protein JSV88_05530 [Candidatus Aminicenantes bacterium]|nr:MAG: hypothetical protein JSV88_05530 [Candidatus Aminicenantes bacterium]